MSYADMAAKGPKQSDAEKVPNAVPEIAHSDSGVHSIDSLSSSNNSVPSYADQQLAKERAEQARDEAAKTATKMSEDAKKFGKQSEADAERLEEDARKKFNELSKQAQENVKRFEAETGKKWQEVVRQAGKNYDQFKQAASKNYEQFKKDAGLAEERTKEGAQKAEKWAEDNKNNPVVIGNVVVIGALSTLLGVGAYRLHRAGTLTWKVAGVWAGAVGLFAVGDYYVSQYFFKKYPPKQ